MTYGGWFVLMLSTNSKVSDFAPHANLMPASFRCSRKQLPKPFFRFRDIRDPKYMAHFQNCDDDSTSSDAKRLSAVMTLAKKKLLMIEQSIEQPSSTALMAALSVRFAGFN